MVPADRQHVAVAAHDPHVQIGTGQVARPVASAGARPWIAVHPVGVHVVGEAGRAADTRHEDRVLGPHPEAPASAAAWPTGWSSRRIRGTSGVPGRWSSPCGWSRARQSSVGPPAEAGVRPSSTSSIGSCDGGGQSRLAVNGTALDTLVIRPGRRSGTRDRSINEARAAPGSSPGSITRCGSRSRMLAQVGRAAGSGGADVICGQTLRGSSAARTRFDGRSVTAPQVDPQRQHGQLGASGRRWSTIGGGPGRSATRSILARPAGASPGPDGWRGS